MTDTTDSSKISPNKPEPTPTADQNEDQPNLPEEIGGPRGPEPTRYGDWEQNGICRDF